MKYLAKSPIARLIHDAGAEKVSAGIVEEIGNKMEDLAFQLAKKAIIVAQFREDVIIRRSHLQAALAIENDKRKSQK
jgi:histone H3/H4